MKREASNESCKNAKLCQELDFGAEEHFVVCCIALE